LAAVPVAIRCARRPRAARSAYNARPYVAGGGFTGVETIASINDFLHDAPPFYPNLKNEMLRVVPAATSPREVAA
jgi:NADH dehydrogenase FAD-containing subunit